MKFHGLGDRMKAYEESYKTHTMPLIPTLARVDGRSFHNFCSGLKKPFDERLSAAMIHTAMHLAKETNASMTYTQSDEITLCWLSTNPKSQIWFNGNHSKMVSQIAALASLVFYKKCLEILPEQACKLPSFDGRVWQVPNKEEAANAFLWRELDATKNSISSAAYSHFSHTELLGEKSSQKLERLYAKGITWEEYPIAFKRGVYIQKRIVSRNYTTSELAKLPPLHLARKNPNLTILRAEWRILNIPPLRKISNREDVIFSGDEPLVAEN